MTRSTNAPVIRPRGRPREFDYGAALDAALQTFWLRGFTGTSVDHLTTAMGLNRPSLYAAFGNKDATFTAAIDHYMATIGRDYVLALNSRPTLREGLTAFFATIIDVASGRRGPTGCAIVCTLPAEAGSSPTVRRQLARALGQVDAAVAARLKTARAAGELPAATDLRAVAQLIAGTMFAIAIRARAGAPRRELTRIARTLVALVADSTPRTRRSPRPRGESPGRDSASARRSLRSLR